MLNLFASLLLAFIVLIVAVFTATTPMQIAGMLLLAAIAPVFTAYTMICESRRSSSHASC